MLKRFLDGLIFGAGFMLAFIVLYTIWVMWAWPKMIESRYSSTSIVEQAPEVEESSSYSIPEGNLYLGSIASYSGDFTDKRNKVLAKGPGLIEGNAYVSDKPAEGLKLRLALNGEVMSQWAVVDKDGRYSVAVPYGEYRIDGHELDMESCNSVLEGKINHPDYFFSRTVFAVSEASKGTGSDFKFVDPVHLNLTKKQFSLSEEVVVDWHAYPGASQYRIQVRGGQEHSIYGRDSAAFDWSDRPVITETSVDLRKLGVELAAGYYYAVEIEALDEKSEILSKTAWNRAGYDFRIE